MIKKLLTLFIAGFISLPFFAQQAYYNDVDLTVSGIQLKNNLATKIINTHTKTLNYTEAREALKIIDLNPGQSNNVLLIYGFSSNTCATSTSDDNDHRRRDKDSFGGGATCEWNREHTYPNSLGTPALGTSGPGADPHHLRASDVQRNGNRGSQKFSDGSGNSGNSGSGWYPGDEWKGDIARMMMYMYLRYGSQCLPTNVGIGSSANTPDDMIDLFLEWNAEDPVSDYEDARNNYLEDTNNTYGQGNRNPFIDNPHLATRIWGGPNAQDRWGGSTTDTEAPSVPTNLTTNNPTDTTIDLSWTTSTDNVGVTSYDIYVDGVNTFNTTNTTFTANNLIANTNYCFTIVAKDAAGNESSQSTQSCETTTNTGSGTGGDCANEDFENIPTNSSSGYNTRTWTGDDGEWTATEARTDQTIDNKAITIDFRGSTNGVLTSPSVANGISDFTITTKYVFSGSAGNLTLVVNGVSKGLIPYSTSEQTTTITGVNVSGNVIIEIKDLENDGSARVAIDNVSWTCFASDSQSPTTPTNLVANNPTDTTIDLSWTASTDNVGVASYDIYVDGVNTFNTTNTTFTANNLTANTNYCFTIVAKDAAGNESSQSTQSCETTTNTGSGTGGDCANEDFENIPTNSSSGYNTRTWTGDDGEWTATEARTDQTIDNKAITIDFRGSTNGVLTSPSVANGIGDFTITTKYVFSGSAGNLTLVVNGVSKGLIPYSNSEQTTTITGVNVSGNVIIEIKDLENDGSARVAIDNVSWTCNSSTLNLDKNIKENIKIYPNPIDGDFLNVEIENLKNITLYNILGKKVLTSNKKNINVSNLKPGVYVAKINSEKGYVTKKIIKK